LDGTLSTLRATWCGFAKAAPVAPRAIVPKSPVMIPSFVNMCFMIFSV
jgi:hypothetical protein